MVVFVTQNVYVKAQDVCVCVNVCARARVCVFGVGGHIILFIKISCYKSIQFESIGFSDRLDRRMLERWKQV